MKKFLLIIAILISISGCQLSSSHPERTVKKFMNALDRNDPSRALDEICESMVIPRMPRNFLEKMNYVEISNDGVGASVHVTGEVRVDDPNLGAVKKVLDFTLDLKKTGNDWCISRESLVNMIESLVDITY